MLELLDLPNELILEVLLKLPFKDRLTTRLLCKRLLKLNSSKCLVPDYKLSIKDYRNLDNYITPNLPAVSNLTINIETPGQLLQLNEYYNYRRVEKFWKTYGNGINSLEVIFTPYSHTLLTEMCNNCPNLEHLSITVLAEKVKSISEVPCDYDALPSVATSKLKTIYLQCDGSDLLVLHTLLANTTALKCLSFDFELNASQFCGRLRPVVKEKMSKPCYKHESLTCYSLPVYRPITKRLRYTICANKAMRPKLVGERIAVMGGCDEA